MDFRFLHFTLSNQGEGVFLGVSRRRDAAEESPGMNKYEQIIQLFREIRVPLYSYLVCLGLEASEADDIVQEAFLRLHTQLRSGTKIEEPRAWTFRVARNLAFNFHRDHRRLVLHSALGPEDAARLQGRHAPEEDPENLYMKEETIMRLDEAMAHLTEPQRQCVHLRAQGLRYREIATVLGITVSSAAELLQRAIVRLAEELRG
jgi:RNA polymerase sigma-70 factor (ECF subfamily)